MVVWIVLEMLQWWQACVRGVAAQGAAAQVLEIVAVLGFVPFNKMHTIAGGTNSEHEPLTLFVYSPVV